MLVKQGVWGFRGGGSSWVTVSSTVLSSCNLPAVITNRGWSGLIRRMDVPLWGQCWVFLSFRRSYHPMCFLVRTFLSLEAAGSIGASYVRLHCFILLLFLFLFFNFSQDFSVLQSYLFWN